MSAFHLLVEQSSCNDEPSVKIPRRDSIKSRLNTFHDKEYQNDKTIHKYG